MAMANQVMNSPVGNLASINIRDEVLEKVMIGQDLSGLSGEEKVAYLGNLCKTLGLNPYTKPFELMKFNGKEIPYARKDCTEQLRKIHNVSILGLDSKILDGIYIVTSYAERAGGVKDSSTGVVSISGLKGEALANAMMKAETKSKRRVTLSICGLGLLDETEIDSIPNVERRNVMEVEATRVHVIQEEPHTMDKDLMDISWADDLETLQDIYKKAYKFWATAKNKDNLAKLMEAKDKRKSEIELSLQADPETGEVI